MERFGEAPKSAQKATEVFSEEQLKNADGFIGDLNLEMVDTDPESHSAVYRVENATVGADPRAEEKRDGAADGILSGQEIVKVIKTDEVKEKLVFPPIAGKEMSIQNESAPEQIIVSTDPNNRMGKNFAAPLPTRKPAPAPKKTGFFGRLFGG